MTDEQLDAFAATGCPKRHRKFTYDLNQIRGTPWAQTLGTLFGLYGTGCLVALVGHRGPGKTQLGVEMIRRDVLADHKALYVRAMDLFIDLKSTYGSRDRSSDNERTVLSRLIEPKLLVIDEISEGAESAWEQRMLGYALDVRYGEAKDTIIIGNFVPPRATPPAQLTEAYSELLKQRVGDSVISRLNECGGMIICSWPSFR